MLEGENSLAEQMYRESLLTATSYNEQNVLQPFCLRVNVSGFTPKSRKKSGKKLKGEKKVGEKIIGEKKI